MRHRTLGRDCGIIMIPPTGDDRGAGAGPGVGCGCIGRSRVEAAGAGCSMVLPVPPDCRGLGPCVGHAEMRRRCMWAALFTGYDRGAGTGPGLGNDCFVRPRVEAAGAGGSMALPVLPGCCGHGEMRRRCMWAVAALSGEYGVSLQVSWGTLGL